MPRQARIDMPGQIYHVMARGIERRAIFSEEADCEDLRTRVSVWLKNSGARCLAWCFMPNHFHLLVLRGERPLSEIMRHVMTGYAVHFNLKYKRAGHLFQNRYKAVICGEERYLQEAVPYIHLNPLRGGLVATPEELKGYRWCGHAAALTGACDGILDRDELLSRFGWEEEGAADAYLRAVLERAGDSGSMELSGAVSSSGHGSTSREKGSGDGGRKSLDRRILGGRDFVESVLKAAGEDAPAFKSRAEVLAEVERSTGVSRMEILSHSHGKAPAQARAAYCYLSVRDAGVGGSELMRELGMTSGAVSKLVAKGKALLKKFGS